MLGMGVAAVWAFILAICGLDQFDISVREVVARQGIFGTSYEVTGVACERWGSVVEFDVAVSVGRVCEELGAIGTLVFECGLVFVCHEVEGMSVFHVHRDGVGLTGFVAVLTFADAVRVADKERLFDPATSRLMKAILM
jgi:hypothetical protein